MFILPDSCFILLFPNNCEFYEQLAITQNIDVYLYVDYDLRK